MSLSEGFHRGEFILSEANGARARENITVLSGQNLKAGHVVGRKLITPTFGAAAAFNTNTGNGVFGTVTAAANAGAQRGTYKIEFVEPATDLGTFLVFDPSGQIVGDGVVGTAFDNQIKFTIADGSADFISGDAFTVAVSGGTYKYKEYDPANTDGSQRVAGILYDNVDASSADLAGCVLRRAAEVRSADLTWFSGATTTQKETATDALEALGIILRS